MDSPKKHYIGRYAPSPTGRLHFGNLRTALLAWLHARLNQGDYLIRMDDLDTSRVVKGSDSQILRDLEWLGLDWDGEVFYQSSNLDHYQSVFQQMKQADVIYPCFCSRKDIQQAVSAPHNKTAVYPGTCLQLTNELIEKKQRQKTPAWRFRVSGLVDEISFIDELCGEQSELMPIDCGDFVIKRADNFFAYQLAVVVDDIKQQITDVVRGYDLLNSTTRQIALFNYLQSKVPGYCHVPLFLNPDGQRMAKRDGSDSVEAWRQNLLPEQQSNTAEALVGYLAFSVGLLDANQAISTNELLVSLRSNTSFIEKIRSASIDCST